jgi:hypothetical protein
MKKISQRKHIDCPQCQASILHFESDQFCLKCDWSTMFADVQSGKFERRLGLTKLGKPKRQSSIVFISDNEAVDEDIPTVSAS